MNYIYTMLFFAAVFMVAACGGDKSGAAGYAAQSAGEAAPGESSASEMRLKTQEGQDGTLRSDNKKILIAYFSHSGNTKNMAQQINDYCGGDIFEIKTISPYPSDYGDCVDQAKKEQNENARPALASNVEDMSVYDIVFVGYPNWWGTMPMAVFNFLESYDFNGKTIVPFCTHEGSAMGRSERDIKQLLPSSEVLNGKPVRGSRVKSSGEDIKSWLEGLGFCK